MIYLKCNIVLWLKSYVQIQVKWYTWESVVQIKQQIYTEDHIVPLKLWQSSLCFGLSALVFLAENQSGSFEFENAGRVMLLLLTSISSFNLNYLAVSFIAVPPPRVFKYLFLSEWIFVCIFWFLETYVRVTA